MGARKPGVTNAILQVELEHQTELLEKVWDEMKQANEDHEARLRFLEGNQRSIITTLESLEKRINSWSIINSLGVVVASALATIGLRQP